MKRLLFIIISIILFSSCGFDDGSGTTTQYTLTATFQYKGVAFRPDSTFVNTSTPKGFGYDALNDKYVDMVEAGIIDPTKVTRSALQNAASVAATVLTTESLVADIPEKNPAPAAAGADMGGMY